jgi:hypothetical protein
MEENTMLNNCDDIFYSNTEKENLLHIKNEFDTEFPVGAVFPTRRLLIDAMREKAAKFGFFIVDRGFAAHCSESDSREALYARRQEAREVLAFQNGRTFKPRKRLKSKCGCEFKVNFTAKKGCQQGEVRISHVQFMHGNGCKPSGEQFKAAWTSGGHASRHVSRTKHLKLHTIVQLLASKQRPSASLYPLPYSG